MLTVKQREVWNFIQNYFRQHGCSPTASEIAQALNIKSRGVAHRYIRALESQGLLQLVPNRHRNIVINPPLQTIKPQQTWMLPVMGSIAAGEPIEAVHSVEMIDIGEWLIHKDHFALRVKGDSMIDEGIHDGDVVVCKSATHAENGQIVVALIDNYRATLKRFFLAGNQQVQLKPANQEMESLVYDMDRITIQGIYLGLLGKSHIT